MNEERIQAYLNLIDTLLNCPGGTEPEILDSLLINFFSLQSEDDLHRCLEYGQLMYQYQ